MNKLNMKDYAILTVLFLVGFWLWTLPIQENPMPFGEHDGAYIFSYGDDMSFKDKTPRIAGDSPTSIDFWYSGYNTVLGPKALEYPPSYVMGYAFAQIFGGERIIPVYIFIAITCFLAVLSMYLLMRKLYGLEAAIMTSTALLFSSREILLYLWGQRHNVTGFALVPIAIYALYAYLDSFYKKEEKIVYLYMFVLLLLTAFFVHFSAVVFLLPFSLILILLLALKNKKIPAAKKNIKHYAIITVLILVVAGPFYLIYFGAENTNVDLGFKDIGSLFYWLKVPDNNFGMNPVFHQYAANYIGYWTLALLLIGIFVLLKRRKNEDMVLISALITLYLMFHMSAFGLIEAGNYRIGRFLILETYFFYAIMTIGVLTFSSFFKMQANLKRYFKWGLVILFLVALIGTQGVDAYKSLKGAYPSVIRITPVQYELSEWIQENIPETSAFHIRGTLTYPKKAFIQILGRRSGDRGEGLPTAREILVKDIIREGMAVPEHLVRGNDWVIPLDYVILDYSDYLALGDKPRFDQLVSMEQEVAKNASLVYDKNYIRVYKYNEN